MKYFFSIENKKCIFTELKDVLWLIVMVARSKSCVVVVKVASFFLLLTEFTCLIAKRLQQNKRYNGTHDLVVRLNMW